MQPCAVNPSALFEYFFRSYSGQHYTKLFEELNLWIFPVPNKSTMITLKSQKPWIKRVVHYKNGPEDFMGYEYNTGAWKKSNYGFGD